MPARRLIALLVLVLAVSACGGSKNAGSQGGSGGTSGSSLVTSVSDAKVEVQGANEVATAKVSVGGAAGRHLTLSWGLVDALQGNQSEDEKVLRRYVTTKKVVSTVETVKVPVARAVSPLLVHFVLYAPDGSYLASDDTPVFGKGS